MKESFYTVDQISQMLNIHPKTIQRYIREGKLRAAKIGKSWRVSGHDLSSFTESNNESITEKSESENRESITASAVVDIQADSRDEAIRIVNSLTAVMNVKPPEYGQSSMYVQFIEPDYKVRVSLWGDVMFISELLKDINAYAEKEH